MASPPPDGPQDAPQGAPRATYFTVGHGARTFPEFVAVLASGPVTRLVDVRRFPGSRRHPHFSRDLLSLTLPGTGITYDFRGDALGGRRRSLEASRHLAWREPSFRAYADHMESAEFQDALASLLEDGAREPLAIMCAETLWWRCHRRLISDALVAHGARVVHLLSPTSQQEHSLSPIARVEGDWPVYDVGCLPGV